MLTDRARRLIGVYSYIPGGICADAAPGVYSRVAAYRNWLTQKIGH
jgi:secreted trypsin-like serine protease